MRNIFLIFCLSLCLFSKESTLMHNLRMLDELESNGINIVCFWFNTDNKKVYDLKDLKSAYTYIIDIIL